MSLDRIARQQWRARIETTSRWCLTPHNTASPASNGGRGLKHGLSSAISKRLSASPASNGGRGLKQAKHVHPHAAAHASPASNGGRGLKPALRLDPVDLADGIARQQWRARIETIAAIATVAASS